MGKGKKRKSKPIISDPQGRFVGRSRIHVSELKEGSLVNRALARGGDGGADKVIDARRSGNKYGAKKTATADGTECRSKLEAYFYDELKKLGIPFEHEAKIVLQEKMNYNGKTVRQAYMKPDFWIPDGKQPLWIVDTKGVITAKWRLQCKLLQARLLEMKEGGLIQVLPAIHTPTNQTDARKLAFKIHHEINKSK